MKFISPLPFLPNCEVSYWFPTDFYDASLITKITTGDLFGSLKRDYFEGDIATQNSFVTKLENDGEFKSVTFLSCQNYRSSDPMEVTTIVGLRQPRSTK